MYGMILSMYCIQLTTWADTAFISFYRAPWMTAFAPGPTYTLKMVQYRYIVQLCAQVYCSAMCLGILFSYVPRYIVQLCAQVYFLYETMCLHSKRATMDQNTVVGKRTNASTLIFCHEHQRAKAIPLLVGSLVSRKLPKIAKGRSLWIDHLNVGSFLVIPGLKYLAKKSGAFVKQELTISIT